MRATRLVRLTILLFSLMPLLAGCWDNQEPRRRAYVLSMGLDQYPENPEQIMITLQLPIPKKRAQSGMGEEKSPMEFTVVKGIGYGIQDALTDAETRISRSLFLGQMRTVVMSDEFPPEQYGLLIQALQRNPDIEETIYMVLVHGRAERLIATPTDLERFPALYLNAAFEAARNHAVSEPVRLFELWRAFFTPGWNPVIPLATVTEEGQIELKGLGVFRGQSLAGVLNEEETQGYLWLMGHNRLGSLPVQVEPKIHVVRSLQGARDLSVRFSGGRPVFTVRLAITGELSAVSADETTDEATIKQVERECAALIARQISAARARIQKEFRSDVFGFGKLLYYRAPRYFDSVDWNQTFPTVPIEFSVTVQVNRTGLTR